MPTPLGLVGAPLEGIIERLRALPATLGHAALRVTLPPVLPKVYWGLGRGQRHHAVAAPAKALLQWKLGKHAATVAAAYGETESR